MRRRSHALFSLLLVAACGDNLEGPRDAGPEPDAPPECSPLTLGARDFHFNLFGQLTGIRYQVTPALGEAQPDYLVLELYDSTTEGLSPLTPGTFDLTAGSDANLATCQHCAWLWQDFVEGDVPTTIYYASKGTLTLDQVDDPLSPVFVGRTSELEIRAATFDRETGNSAVIPGGRCFTVAPVELDTRTTTGRACASAEDCGNALLEICDPRTATCGAPQCADFSGCEDPTDICLTQHPHAFEGACSPTCDPRVAGACGSGQDCVQFGVQPDFGVCRHNGAGAAGSTCTPADVATSCVEGLNCEEGIGACLPTCTFFADDTGCTAGNACYVLGTCRPTSSGSPATFGQPCGAGYALADGCASDGEAFRGICFSFTDTLPLVCEEACLAEADCAPDQFCALRFTSGLGVCKPDPVCGDGELGEIDEVCDDGDTESGDGCSGDCQTVEYGVLCAAAPALGPNATVTGTTLHGIDGFQTSCQAGTARARIYELTPPGRGRLTLHLESATRQTVAVRTDCDDTGTELGCKLTPSVGTGTDLVVQVTTAHPGPFTVLVTAGTVLDEGAFTLTTSFVAEQCGDSIIAGNEVCDDGNTTPNDGCSANCRTIEYDRVCALAPALSTTASVMGDTTGGPNYFEASCSNTLFGSGPDRVYRYTAPSAGTLHVTLDQTVNGTFTDLALSISDGCGASGTVPELGCSSVVDVEDLEVALTAGQEVLVIVEGFSANGTGMYTLTATFTP